MILFNKQNLVIFFIALLNTCYAESKWGFIVLKDSKDTVRCFIKYNGATINNGHQEKVNGKLWYKLNESDKYSTITGDKVISYGFYGSRLEYWEVVPFRSWGINCYGFMDPLYKGKRMAFYSFSFVNGSTGDIVDVIVKDSKTTFIKRGQFRRKMKRLVSDCKEVYVKFSLKEYKKRDFYSIIMDYDKFCSK